MKIGPNYYIYYFNLLIWVVLLHSQSVCSSLSNANHATSFSLELGYLRVAEIRSSLTESARSTFIVDFEVVAKQVAEMVPMVTSNDITCQKWLDRTNVNQFVLD